MSVQRVGSKGQIASYSSGQIYERNRLDCIKKCSGEQGGWSFVARKLLLMIGRETLVHFFQQLQKEPLPVTAEGGHQT